MKLEKLDEKKINEAGKKNIFHYFRKDQLLESDLAGHRTMNFLSLNANQAISTELIQFIGKVPGLVLVTLFKE